MSKHTPGPWQVGNFNPDMICDCDGEVRGCSQIAFVEGTAAEKRANARLIAASPDLLDALKAVDKEWSEFWPLGPDVKHGGESVAHIADETAAIWRKIRAAIAKAEGATK